MNNVFSPKLNMRYNLLFAFYQSFYAKSLYQEVAQHWRGWGLIYLHLLVAFCSIIYTYQLATLIPTLLSSTTLVMLESHLRDLWIVNTAANLNLSKSLTHYWIYSGVYPLVFSVLLLQILLETAIYSVLAKLFMHTQLSYKTLYRLASVAITPATLLSTLLFLIGLRFAFDGLVYMLVSLVYLLYGIEANKA